LVGRQRSGPSGLDPDLVQKIFAAELGVPTAVTVSLDGVTATVTPTHHRNSVAIPTRRASATDPVPGTAPGHQAAWGR
jgi:hypothetical protein